MAYEMQKMKGKRPEPMAKKKAGEEGRKPAAKAPAKKMMKKKM
jgi:hypothetical protein